MLRQAVTAGMRLPDGHEPPQLFVGSELFWTAYWQLATCRTGRWLIPWDITQRWAETHALDEDTAADLHYIVREMDAAYVDFVKSRQPKEKPR